MARFIPKSQNLALLVGQNGVVESWDLASRKKLFRQNVSSGAQITDLSFQPLNDYCVFSLDNKAWNFYDISS